MPVSGVRPRSANPRHECFRTDASVPTDTAPAPELEEERSSERRLAGLLLCHGEPGVSGASRDTPGSRPTQQSWSRPSTRSLLRQCGRQLADLRLSHIHSRSGGESSLRARRERRIDKRHAGGWSAPAGDSSRVRHESKLARRVGLV